MPMIISDEFDRILNYAADEAMRTGSMEVGADHLLLAIIRDGENEAADILRMLGVDLQECKHFIESRISHGAMVPFADRDNVRLSREAGSLINMSMAESERAGGTVTGTAQALSALMGLSGGAGRMYLSELGVTAGAVRSLAAEHGKPKPDVPHPNVQFIGIFNTNNKTVS